MERSVVDVVSSVVDTQDTRDNYSDQGLVQHPYNHSLSVCLSVYHSIRHGNHSGTSTLFSMFNTICSTVLFLIYLHAMPRAPGWKVIILAKQFSLFTGRSQDYIVPSNKRVIIEATSRSAKRKKRRGFKLFVISDKKKSNCKCVGNCTLYYTVLKDNFLKAYFGGNKAKVVSFQRKWWISCGFSSVFFVFALLPHNVLSSYRRLRDDNYCTFRGQKMEFGDARQ